MIALPPGPRLIVLPDALKASKSVIFDRWTKADGYRPLVLVISDCDYELLSARRELTRAEVRRVRVLVRQGLAWMRYYGITRATVHGDSLFNPDAAVTRISRTILDCHRLPPRGLHLVAGRLCSCQVLTSARYDAAA